MPDYNNAQKTGLFSVDEQEKYMLYSKEAIIRVLNELSKKPDIITAYFNGGKEYLLTAVLGVLTDRDLVVLDLGPDEKRNERALERGRLVCVSKHDNIDIKFRCEGLRRARYQGRAALACPLPESLYRLQRREFFRVATPTINVLKCRIPQQDTDPLELPIVDISCGGVGLHDLSRHLEAQPPDIIRGCGIELPEFGFLVVDLQVRNIIPQTLNDGREVNRVGCAFMGLSLDKNALIQRYINKLQVDQKALENP